MDDKDKNLPYDVIFTIIRNALASIGLFAMFVIACFLYGYKS